MLHGDHDVACVPAKLDKYEKTYLKILLKRTFIGV